MKVILEASAGEALPKYGGYWPPYIAAAVSDNDTGTGVRGWGIRGEGGSGCGDDWRGIPPTIMPLLLFTGARGILQRRQTLKGRTRGDVV